GTGSHGLHAPTGRQHRRGPVCRCSTCPDRPGRPLDGERRRCLPPVRGAGRPRVDPAGWTAGGPDPRATGSDTVPPVRRAPHAGRGRGLVRRVAAAAGTVVTRPRRPPPAAERGSRDGTAAARVGDGTGGAGTAPAHQRPHG